MVRPGDRLRFDNKVHTVVGLSGVLVRLADERLCAERAVDALNAGFGLRPRGPRGDPSEDRLNACTSS